MANIKKYPELRFGGFDEDWEELMFNEIAKINPKQELPEEFNYVDLESVVGTEMITYRKEIKKTAPSRAQRLASKGDIFYQTVRPYQKNNFLYNRDDKDFVFSTGYAQLRPSIDNNFLFTIIQKDDFVQIVLNNCTGTSYPAINSSVLGNIKQYFAKDTFEQQKVGNFFQNLDQLIAQHQQKHGKLKALKKAMLSKMFPKQGQSVPEIRFKGFSGEWGENKLSTLGDSYTGLTGKTKSDFGHGEGRYITYMNVFSNQISDLNSIGKIDIDSMQNQVKAGDVLFTVSSETAEEVGMSSVWTGNQEHIYLNSFCFGYRLKIKMDWYFLANMLRAPKFRNRMKLLAQGISRYNISKTKVMEIYIDLPCYEEQEKIGNFFKNLDELITSHKMQIEKFNNLKKAFLAKMFI